MATTKQRQAARKNVKKAQSAWQSMSSRARSSAQPEGWDRSEPGTTGKGEYYHIEVRPRVDVPEKKKPTTAQKRARIANIKKAQAARRTG